MPKTSVKGSLKRESLSQAQQDYVKALFQLRREQQSVPTSQLAGRLSVSAAAATEMLGKLAAFGLVSYDRYRGATLTKAGESVALEMVRHHRLIEMYLAKALGYRWDEVHDEAERLEHHISEQMEQRIFEALGRPDLDPHGDPIPTLGGQMTNVDYRSLDECSAGERLTVKRVSDSDAGKLRALHKAGVTLGTRLKIVAASVYEGPIEVRIGKENVQLPLGLARIVFCSAA